MINKGENTYSYVFYKALESLYMTDCIALLEKKGWPYHIKEAKDADEIVFKMIKGFSLPPAYEFALFAPAEYFERLDTLFAQRKFYFADNDDIRKVFLENSLKLSDMVTILQTDDDSFDSRDRYLMKEILYEQQSNLESQQTVNTRVYKNHHVDKKKDIYHILIYLLLSIITLVVIFRFLL